MVNKYYQKHKEKLRKKAFERYQNLSEEEKHKSPQKARERYQNFTREEKEKRCHYQQEHKQKLHEYRRNCYLTHKK